VVIGGAIALKDGSFRHGRLGVARWLLELTAACGRVELINTRLLFGWGFTGWRAVSFDGAEEPL